MHPTRTNLLLLREKTRSVANSIGILKARKQALIREFLNTSLPFLKSREEIRKSFANALQELAFTVGIEGRERIESFAAATAREFEIAVTEKSIWGLRYKDVIMHDIPVRSTDARGYDEHGASLHLEECSLRFEKLLESMMNIAEYENKMKRLGEEIMKTNRKIRVLEEILLPDLRDKIRVITQFISERERETHFRLKKFKDMRQ